jgi:CRP-like cAMP-binding protein
VQLFQGYSVRGRICVELLRLCGGRQGVALKITDVDISTRVGATRSHVNRIVNELVGKGRLSRPEPGTIVVLDVGGLEATRMSSQLSE